MRGLAAFQLRGCARHNRESRLGVQPQNPNTVAQIAFVGLVLGALALKFDLRILLVGGSFIVAALTIVSGAFYLRDWVKHLSQNGEKQ